MALISVMVFCILLIISAPYGRHARSGWGRGVQAKAAWIMMEAPASLIKLAAMFVLSLNPVIICLLLVWQIHYFHRAFIYPFSLRTERKMPFSVMGIAFFFNAANGLLNAWHFRLYADWYTLDWFLTSNFWGGLGLFVTGYVLIKKADRSLAKLCNPGPGSTASDYVIPYGPLYRYVSYPNYLGETIQCMGWALMTLSPAGWVFFIWTVANLLPRAISHHRWYLETFQHYPRERKAMIPFLI